MIKIAKKVIVVTDSRKFARRRFAYIGPISDVDVVITDSGINRKIKSDWKKPEWKLLLQAEVRFS